MSKIAIFERSADGRLEGKLYSILRREPQTDRPTDTSAALPVEKLDGDWIKVKLPNKKLFVQIDGTPIEGYVPMRAKSGDVDIASYERVRYQTLRDGIVVEEAAAYDGVFEIVDPRAGIPASYTLPAIIGENVIPDEPGGIGVRITAYTYPRYYGDGATGEHRSPELAYSHRNGTYARAYGKYYDPAGVVTGAQHHELPISACGLVRVHYRRGSGGLAGSREYDVGSVTYELLKTVSEEEKLRLRNVIQSLGPLNYEINGQADPAWLLNTVTSQRGIVRSMYLRGDIKGVYAKEISK